MLNLLPDFKSFKLLLPTIYTEFIVRMYNNGQDLLFDSLNPRFPLNKFYISLSFDIGYEDKKDSTG